VDYRLVYTQKALNDLAEILGHIAEDDAKAASRFGNSWLDHIDLLARFPRMGGVIRKRPQVANYCTAQFCSTTGTRGHSRSRGSSSAAWSAEATRI
jgi:plasmid stabilization system protein ParE